MRVSVERVSAAHRGAALADMPRLDHNISVTVNDPEFAAGLEEVERVLEPSNLRLARETYLTAWGMAVSVADHDALSAVSRAVRALSPPGRPS